VDAVVRTAEREIRELLKQRAELMKRIGTIKQTLAGLADMFGDSILNDELLDLLDRKTVRQSGFTRACRTVLMQSEIPLSAREVRDRISPELIARHKDALASITTVLSRLVGYSEARCIVLAPGRRVWEWVAERAETRELVGAGQSCEF
jgi:chorismate mutase